MIVNYRQQRLGGMWHLLIGRLQDPQCTRSCSRQSPVVIYVSSLQWAIHLYPRCNYRNGVTNKAKEQSTTNQEDCI
jgi:hypothetical protein